MMAPLHGSYSEANAQTARIVAAHPGRMIGFTCLHATRDPGHIFSMVRHCTSKYRCRGIKVHGSAAMPTREICEVARSCLRVQSLPAPRGAC